MRHKKSILIIITTLFLAGCGSQKVLTTYQDNARSAEEAGNFEAATENWQSYLDKELAKGNPIPPVDFAHAAKTAYKAHKTDLAISWFDKAQHANYSDAEMYLDIAAIYKQKNNLSKELEALELLRNKFPDTTDSTGVNTRLFDIYSDISSNEKAAAIWPSINPENRKKEKYLTEYFAVQKHLDHDAVTDSTAKAILEVNPKSVDALEWLGVAYYHKAEDRYQREMKKYNANRTHMQHFKLVQQLNIVTDDFKKSLSYFQQLWKTKQDPRYATYMTNIYTRFKDPRKANYYRKFIK